MQSPERPSLADHQEARRKYITLAWDLWREQQAQDFFVWHPIPEEHLRIELALFWEGQISHVHGWNNIIGQIIDAIVTPIKAALTWLWENLIRPGVDALLYVIRSVLSGINAVVKGISSALNVVWSSLLAGLSSMGTWLWNGIQAVGGKIAEGVSWLWKQVQGFFSALGEVLKQIGTWIITAIKTYVVDPILALLRPVFEGVKSLMSALFTFMTGGAVTGSPIVWRGSVVRWVGIITGIGVMAVSGLIGAELVNLVHPFKDTKAGEIAKFAMQFSGIAFLQAAFFGTYFDIACSKPVRQELNAMFTPEIPGSGDLIRFVVREVIVPDEFHVAMSLQGFSRYWSEAYWEAHWLLPPPERTRTAFLRKQIPEAEFRKFLIWYDFKPEPRPGISLSDVDIMLQTQYDWPGRIDMRWMVEWGVVPMEGLVEMLKADGMDPAWAPQVAEAWLLNQLREELGKVRAVYERRLREGFMDKTSFAEALNTIHYAAHVINALVRWADEELDLDERIELAKEYETLAKEGIWTPETYGQELRKIGMVEERITRKQRHIRHLLALKAAKEAAKAKT